MILDRLELTNFGVYGGYHSIELTPPSESQPVILIGAMNGSGKTSFLQALHLVLFGHRAVQLSRGAGGYDAYLLDRIHDLADPADGASVRLTFRHWRQGQPEEIAVTRGWAQKGSKVREWVEVLRDRAFDALLTESWSERVEEFLPRGLAHLFFFDAEQIADIVTDANAREVLRTGILNLLGLDLVEQLDTDLAVIHRRQRMQLADEVERDQLDAQAELVRGLLEQRSQLHQTLAGERTKLALAEKHLEALEERLRHSGGDLFEQREAIEAKRRGAQAKLDAVEEEMRTLAAGNAPLLLVRPLLERTLQQAERELAAAEADVLVQTLVRRDEQLLAMLAIAGVDEKALEQAREHLSSDRTAYLSQSKVERYLHPTPQSVAQLRALLEHELDATQAAVRDALARTAALREQLDLLDQRLEQIPDRAAIAGLMAERGRLQAVVDSARAEVSRLAEDEHAATVRHEAEVRRLESQIESLARATHDNEGHVRTADFAARARETLGLFRDSVLRQHIARIEAAILGCYKRLLRKQGLVAGMKIEPTSFELSLFAADGRVLIPDRLSAGERQLLAVSMLWGLAQASGRALPAVIDTPLGRLDSVHRERLVERYFPLASHQVLVLSTDEEIDAGYFGRLKPFVGRSYLLRFDEVVGTTRVEDGYFWG